MRLSIIANVKLVANWLFNMFKNLMVIDYLEHPFTTSHILFLGLLIVAPWWYHQLLIHFMTRQ